MFLLLNQCFAMMLAVTVTTVTAPARDAVTFPIAALGAPAAATTATGGSRISAETNRDKTGTNPSPRNGGGSETAKNKPKASGGSFVAEGRGLEPPTAFAAPDFESSR